METTTITMLRWGQVSTLLLHPLLLRLCLLLLLKIHHFASNTNKRWAPEDTVSLSHPNIQKYIKLTQEAGRLGLSRLPAPSAVGSCKLGHNSTILQFVNLFTVLDLNFGQTEQLHMQLNFDYKLLQHHKMCWLMSLCLHIKDAASCSSSCQFTFTYWAAMRRDIYIKASPAWLWDSHCLERGLRPV